MSDNTQDKPLSRRDHIAAQTMAAMIIKFGVHEDLQDHAIETTDKLIRALDGESEEQSALPGAKRAFIHSDWRLFCAGMFVLVRLFTLFYG